MSVFWALTFGDAGMAKLSSINEVFSVDGTIVVID